MFICNLLTQKISFFDGCNIVSILWDFHVLYKKIQASYVKKKNFFIDFYWTLDSSDIPLEILLSKENKVLQISTDLIHDLWIRKILGYLFAFDIDAYRYINSEQSNSEIFYTISETKDLKEIFQINEEEELLRYGISYKTTFDQKSALYTTIANFSFERWKYNWKHYIDTDAMGIDPDKDMSIEKSLSESIERASWSNTINLISVKATDLSNTNIRILSSFWVHWNDILVWWFLQSLVSTEELFLSENLLCYPVATKYQYETNSSGMATHNSLDEAVYSALMELIERDSFLYSWLLKSKFVYKLLDDMLPSNILKTIKSCCSYACEFYLLDSYVPVYSVMCILYKNWKNMISLWTSVKLDEAIEKSFQESRNSIDFLDLDIKSLEKLNNSSVMSHILYYLDPNNADKLLWIKKSQAYDKTKDYRISLKDYQSILDWFKANNIDLWYFEYKNLVNSVFHRKTVRVFSSWLLPIYFWSVIPNNILQHQRLAGKTINYDLHPLG